MRILEVNGVSKFYKEHKALDQVSFDVPNGSIFGLLGPNGAGKTSLIRIINQITAPDEGSILLNGEKLDHHHIAQIGYLPEERGLYKKMTVLDQLIYFARLRGMNSSKAKKTVDEWLTRFEALDWKKKKVEELSKGMQQKIQFIATVLHSPKFIILDEPFTGFDPKNTQLIKDEIERLKNEGASIMLSTHRMENVEEICDHVVLINQAKVVTRGTVKDIRNSLKNNIFRLRYQGNLNLNELPIEVKNASTDDGVSQIDFQYSTEKNDLRLFEGQSLDIIEYRELMPSMQEVFLTLTKSNDE